MHTHTDMNHMPQSEGAAQNNLAQAMFLIINQDIRLDPVVPVTWWYGVTSKKGCQSKGIRWQPFSPNQGHTVRRVKQAGVTLTRSHPTLPLLEDWSTLLFKLYTEDEDRWVSMKEQETLPCLPLDTLDSWTHRTVINHAFADQDSYQAASEKATNKKCKKNTQSHNLCAFFSQIAVHSYFAPDRNHRKHPRLHICISFSCNTRKKQPRQAMNKFDSHELNNRSHQNK